MVASDASDKSDNPLVVPSPIGFGAENITKMWSVTTMKVRKVFI